MAKIYIISRSRPADDQRIASISAYAKSLQPDCEVIVYAKGYFTPKNRGADGASIQKVPQAFIQYWGKIGRLLALLRLISLEASVATIVYNDTDFKLFIYLYKILFGGQFWLDVQENHTQNFIWNRAQSSASAKWKGWLFRILFSFQFEDKFFLAERCYAHELVWKRTNRLVLLENGLDGSKKNLKLYRSKSEGLPTPLSSLEIERLLIYGTLGPHYGTKEGMEILKKLRASCFPKSEIVLLGFAPLLSYRKALEPLRNQPSITYKSWGDSVPFAEIEGLLSDAKETLLLLNYEINGATRDRIPTKLREAFRFGLSVAFRRNPAWELVCLQNDYRAVDCKGEAALEGYAVFARENSRLKSRL